MYMDFSQSTGQFVSCSQIFLKLNCYLLSLLCVHNILFRTLHYEISHISHVEDSNEFTKKCNAYTTCTSPIMHLICLPKFCISMHCFQFLLGQLEYPGEMKNKGYAKFWEANKMHYGRCPSGVCAKLLFCLSNLLKLSLPLSLPLSLHKVINCTFKQQMLFFFKIEICP